jgi:hypothetical protein
VRNTAVRPRGSGSVIVLVLSILPLTFPKLSPAGRMYKFAMREVKRTQDYVHAKLAQDVQGIEIAVKAMLAADSHGSADKAIVGTLTDFVNARANYVVSEWQALLPRLITT